MNVTNIVSLFLPTQVLPDQHSRDMCLRFADMESKLGEIDRARAIYSFCSQICDPRVSRQDCPRSTERGSPPRRADNGPLCLCCLQLTAHFWQTWKEFEIRHGNEDTIREMLRIKRSVQATYNTQVNFMTSQMMKATTLGAGMLRYTCTHSHIRTHTRTQLPLCL